MKTRFQIECSRDPWRKVLKTLGFSWKKARKLLNKANPQQRAGFLQVSFYGLYLYDLAQVRIWPYEAGNQDNTVEVLERLRAEFPDLPIKLVWDGAPYHRAKRVSASAHDLNIGLVPLPAYSPDFMPVEHLGHWLREEITYHTCYEREADLIAQVERFQFRLNDDPLALSQRLWVSTQLDPEVEKLRVST